MRRQSKPAKNAYRRLEPRLSAFKKRLNRWDEDARWRASRKIEALGRPALQAVIKWAGDKSWRVREMACWILGKTVSEDYNTSLSHEYYPDGAHTLVDRLKNDPNPWVRSAAAISLVKVAPRIAARELPRAAY